MSKSKSKQEGKEINESSKVKSKKNSNLIDFNLSVKVKSCLFGINKLKFKKENYNNIFNVSKKGSATNTLNKTNDLLPVKQTYLLPLDYHVNIDRFGQIFLRDPTVLSTVYPQDDNKNETNTVQQNDERMEIENYENIEEDHLVVETATKNVWIAIYVMFL